MSELLIAVFAFVILVYVAYPLFAGKDSPIEHKDANPLSVEKQSLLESIKEAEFDFHAGKLSESDYHSLRAPMEEKLSDVLQQLKSNKYHKV